MTDKPEGVTILKNGTQKVGGRFVSGPLVPMFTDRAKAVEAGRKGAEARREKAAAYSRKYVTEAVQQGGLDAKGPAQAVGMMAGEFARSALANAMDKPRDAVHAAKLALKLADMLAPEQRGGSVAAVQVVVTAGAELDSVEGEWVDAGEGT